MKLLQSIGGLLEAAFMQAGAYAGTLFKVVRGTASPPWYPGLILRQAEEVGVQSLPVVLLTALFTGMVLALRPAPCLQKYQSASYVALN